MALVSAPSARNLAVGSGNVSTTSGVPQLAFVNTQAFKRGAAVVVDYAGTAYYFTIADGSDKIWNTVQAASASVSGKAFKTTDPGTRRGRGTDGVIVPGATHYMYRSPLDNAAIADWPNGPSLTAGPTGPSDGPPPGVGGEA